MSVKNLSVTHINDPCISIAMLLHLNHSKHLLMNYQMNGFSRSCLEPTTLGLLLLELKNAGI